jgi:DNA-directed RNA polymerase specialized sigma24 family protein
MSPRDRSDDERFHVFAARSTGSLTRLAYLLCGDQHLANDLVQTCLVRLYQAWPSVRDKDTADAYARKVLLRCWLNERRRPWRRVESRDGLVPDTPVPEPDLVRVVHLKEVIRGDSRSFRLVNAPRWCCGTGHSTR